ncbi:MAG: trypsin-like peptidase domain-containing protein [Thermoproteota archaeon]|nr:trypsin-like peptidase domain-containing protein [Thermoproteota archaeon]
MLRETGTTISALVILTVMISASSLYDQQYVTAETDQIPITLSNFVHAPETVFGTVDNSVVQITSKVSNLQNQQIQNATEIGSGFVYDTQGHIITASHVVDGTPLVDVTFVDGSRYTAKTIGRDPYSDIAVVQIVESTIQPLKPLVIENSSGLRVGEQVIAIGHPFGMANTMTTGIIAQIGYLLSIPDIGVFFPDIIQTDAAINPGNSGGPLLNTKAQVIGINIGRIISIGAPGPYPGLTVAAPSNALLRIVPTLIANGNYSHPYVGLIGSTLTSDLAQTITNLPKDFKGILVNSIFKDGPADKAGINASTVDKYDRRHWGDIITAVDGRVVVRVEDLISYVEQHKSVGERLNLSVYRNGQTITLQAILSARPPPLIQNPQSLSTPPL